MKTSNKKRNAAILALACCLGASAWAHEPSGKPGSAESAKQPSKKLSLDRSGAAREKRLTTANNFTAELWPMARR